MARTASGPASAEPDWESLLRQAAGRLLPRAGELSSARLEAELLAAHVLSATRAALLTAGPPAPAARARFESLVAERVATARPVAYLVGWRDFRDLRLVVDERVLVPRPETELLLEVFERLLSEGRLPPGPVADRGTGSGALAVCAAAWRPVLACDCSHAALAVARANLVAHPPRHAVLLVAADGLGAVAPKRLAAVLANPPYIEAADFDGLPADVRDHEPRGALVPAEASVALAFSRLLAESAAALAPGGWLLTEVGAGQAADVSSAARAAGWQEVSVAVDLAGHGRVVCARRA